MFKIGKFIEKESQLVVARGCEERKLGLTVERYKISFWGDGNVLGLDSGDVAQLCEYTKKPLNCAL